MLPLLESIKTIIERYIVGLTPLTAQANIGDTTITVASTRRLCVGDDIVIFNKPNATTQAEGEVKKIETILNRSLFTVNEPMAAIYPVGTSYTEKLIGYTGGDPRFLEAVYIGDPAVIPRYPAITIDGKSRSSKWMTIESTQEDYEIEITLYIDSADYESQMKLMYNWVKQIEQALFRSFYPLIDPYELGILEEDAQPSDDTIRLTDHSINECILGTIFLESYDRTMPNYIRSYLGNGVYQLVRPVQFHFSAGDKVIRPGRHVFNTLPYSTRYGTINKGSMLKAAVISYRASEEVKRLNPYIDPLTS
jgi:hypothetical protein